MNNKNVTGLIDVDTEPIDCPECGEQGFDVSLSIDEPVDRTICGGQYIRGDDMYPPTARVIFHCHSCRAHELHDMTNADFMWFLTEFLYPYTNEMEEQP